MSAKTGAAVHWHCKQNEILQEFSQAEGAEKASLGNASAVRAQARHCARMTATLHDLARYSGDPWTPDNTYFAIAESAFDALWPQLIWPFIEGCDFSNCVDLAAGHGRNSTKLVTLANGLTLLHIQPGNVEFVAAASRRTRMCRRSLTMGMICSQFRAPA
jgi:hypothetical protein